MKQVPYCGPHFWSELWTFVLHGSLMVNACVMVHSLCLKEENCSNCAESVKCHCAKLSCPGAQACRICASLVWTLQLCSDYQVFIKKKKSLHCCWRVKKSVRWSSRSLLLGIVLNIYLLALGKTESIINLIEESLFQCAISVTGIVLR